MAEVLTTELSFGRYKYGYGTDGSSIRKLIWIEDAVLLDTQTITVGNFGSVPNVARGVEPGVFGSIVDGVSDIYSANILGLEWIQNGGVGTDFIQLTINGVQTNIGWTTMSISGPNGVFNYSRASATFSNPNPTSWGWENLGFTEPNNPFGAVASNVIVTFY